ncbi:DUF6766 family protein [Haloferula sp. BvORR071]|uniref:DUF6766 family protein n=1 Tax=Haloferula sp. BvORR071 TaxID=1396141 RepID=UPI00054E2B29|nr:DUF6766 family protein [Haloferula sp. BvORR071]
MRKFLHDNSLSLVLVSLFLGFWFAQAWSGFKLHNEEQEDHGKPAMEFTSYLRSGHFWQATGENWESEFLQMGAYVVLTTYLFQRGSAESNDPDKAEELRVKRKTSGASWIYRNSLSVAFLALFAISFAIHAAGGLVEFNEELAEHGKPAASLGEFLGGAEFWFQSFQNWQSEFLAVLSIVVLSIFLRQNGSPESKDVSDSNLKTGG